MTTVDATDFALTVLSGTAGGNLASNAVVPVGGSGISHDVTATDVSGDGSLRLDVVAGGLTDLAGNVLGAGFTSGQTYIISQIVPAFHGYPNPVSTTAQVTFTIPYTGMYTITLYDSKGTKISLLRQGSAEAGARNTIKY